MIIPYLTPELPEQQKQALHALVKTPLVYTSVAIRNSRAFDKLGVTVNVIRVGTYKSFAEPYIANGPSPAAAEASRVSSGMVLQKKYDSRDATA